MSSPKRRQITDAWRSASPELIFRSQSWADRWTTISNLHVGYYNRVVSAHWQITDPIYNSQSESGEWKGCRACVKSFLFSFLPRCFRSSPVFLRCMIWAQICAKQVFTLLNVVVETKLPTYEEHVCVPEARYVYAFYCTIYNARREIWFPLTCPDSFHWATWDRSSSISYCVSVHVYL